MRAQLLTVSDSRRATVCASRLIYVMLGVIILLYPEGNDVIGNSTRENPVQPHPEGWGHNCSQKIGGSMKLRQQVDWK